MMRFDRFSTFDNFFNWTMGYKQGDDVHAPYGSITMQKQVDLDQKPWETFV